jgi:hypothetical protein
MSLKILGVQKITNGFVVVVLHMPSYSLAFANIIGFLSCLT